MKMNQTHVQKVRLLYKTILRLHRGLPEELRIIGTNYAKEEFKRHKKCSDKESEIFMNEWSMYAVSLAKQLGLRGPKTGSKEFGQNLSPHDLHHFRAEQICQLYELLTAAKGEESGAKVPQ